MTERDAPIIYLAGPEVFLPEARTVLEKNRLLCEEAGFRAVTPMDTEIPPELSGLDRARFIYRENRRLIQNCDIIVANCNSFRGALVDDGTSWEIGYGASLQKRIYGFIRIRLTLPEIVATKIDLVEHSSGYPVDLDGYLVNEDFGNSVNLMIEVSMEESGGTLIEGGLRETLARIRKDLASPSI